MDILHLLLLRLHSHAKVLDLRYNPSLLQFRTFKGKLAELIPQCSKHANNARMANSSRANFNYTYLRKTRLAIGNDADSEEFSHKVLFCTLLIALTELFMPILFSSS